MASPRSFDLETGPEDQPRQQRLTPVRNTGKRRTRKPPTFQKGWDGNLDSFDLDDPLYAENAWYTAARGSDKTSANIHLRIPGYISEALDQVVAAKYFPEVRTNGDFIRSAIVHELHRRIGEVSDSGFHVEVTAHTDLATINALRAENEAARAFVLYCKEELETVAGNPTMTHKILEQVWAAIEGGRYDGALHVQLEDLARKYAQKPKPVR